MGCTLLTYQNFEDGWSFFEYGLRTEAQGAQKWQRALPKPFSHEECPLWRGENLKGKNILLLEEQAIGDVMQFLTLLKSLIIEAGTTSLLLSDRLIPLYNKSFSEEISAGSLKLLSFKDITLIML